MKPRRAYPLALAPITQSQEFTILPTEAEIQKKIIKALETVGIYAWRNNVGGPRASARGSAGYDVKAGRGTADVMGILAGGRFLGIEVKKPNGKTSKERAELQRSFREKINARGGLAFQAESVDQVLAALKREGVIR